MYLELSLGFVTQGGPIKIGLALSHSALKIIIETKLIYNNIYFLSIERLNVKFKRTIPKQDLVHVAINP